MRRAQRLFENQGLHVPSSQVDFQVRGRMAGPYCVTPPNGFHRLGRWMTDPERCVS